MWNKSRVKHNGDDDDDDGDDQTFARWRKCETDVDEANGMTINSTQCCNLHHLTTLPSSQTWHMLLTSNWFFLPTFLQLQQDLRLGFLSTPISKCLINEAIH